MVKVTLHIEGMMCGMCEAHMNDAIRGAFAVKKVSSSHAKKETVVIAEKAPEESLLRDTVTKLGYELLSIDVEPYEKKGFFSMFQKN